MHRRNPFVSLAFLGTKLRHINHLGLLDLRNGQLLLETASGSMTGVIRKLCRTFPVVHHRPHCLDHGDGLLALKDTAPHVDSRGVGSRLLYPARPLLAKQLRRGFADSRRAARHQGHLILEPQTNSPAGPYRIV